MSPDVRLTMGHILRHAPAKGGQGIEAALVDIAQDLLLRDLHARGAIDALAFKGGTALRKLYAGMAGRFSTDLDFSVRSVEDDMGAAVELLIEAIADTRCGPFQYGILERRGKPYLTIENDLRDIETLTCKLDVNPPPWLPTEQRSWVPMPIHRRYGGPLPELHVIRIEENIAEKIARLNRVTPARDAYDLVWIMENRARLNRDLDLDLELIRRLAIIKVWVDMNGLNTTLAHWKPAHEPQPFDPDHWLRERSPDDFDDQSIGLLATTPPALDELARSMSHEYGFLRDLTPEERILARCNGHDRPLLLHLLSDLPSTQMTLGSCW